MSTALFSILYRPFLSWKKTERNLIEARERGFPIYVAWDNRNTKADWRRVREYTPTIYPFKSEGHTGHAYRFVPRIKEDFVLMVADDELCTPELWAFAAAPPTPSRYGILILPVLGDRFHSKHLGSQERLTWVEGWRYTGRTMADGTFTMFEGGMSSPMPMAILDDQMGCAIFHYLLEAPEAEREEKAARYHRIDPQPDAHRDRLFPTDADLAPLPDFWKQHRPRGE